MRQDCHIVLNSEAEDGDLSILLPVEDITIHDQPPGATPVPPNTIYRFDCYYPSPSTSAAIPKTSLWELLRPGDFSYPRAVSKKRPRFSYKERDIVCLHLALALLHLSRAPWKGAYWGSDHRTEEGIFFLRDPATDQIVDRTHPYLSYRLHHRTPSQPQQHNKILPCDGRLLKFAKLITEIQLWERLPSSEILEPPAKLSEAALRNYLLDILGTDDWVREGRENLRKAITACLSPEGKDAARDDTNTERLPSFIFRNIVQPLDQYAGFPDFPSPCTAQRADGTKKEEPNPYSIFDWKTENRRTISADQRFVTPHFVTGLEVIDLFH